MDLVQPCMRVNISGGPTAPMHVHPQALKACWPVSNLARKGYERACHLQAAASGTSHTLHNGEKSTTLGPRTSERHRAPQVTQRWRSASSPMPPPKHTRCKDRAESHHLPPQWQILLCTPSCALLALHVSTACAMRPVPAELALPTRTRLLRLAWNFLLFLSGVRSAAARALPLPGVLTPAGRAPRTAPMNGRCNKRGWVGS